jgi:hypothetical protein
MQASFNEIIATGLYFKSELHKIPARVQCTVQCADWIDEPAPPTIP